MNKYNQMILSQSDLVSAWLSDNEVGEAIFDDPAPINIYNEWCRTYDIDGEITLQSAYTGDNYAEHCIQNWNMPEDYRDLDIVRFINNRPLTYEQRERVHTEIQLFQERGMIPVLRFLAYLVDTCNENNIVLGVGRGSSVSSYVLYLLGVHKIDSIKYNLDIKEFLK